MSLRQELQVSEELEGQCFGASQVYECKMVVDGRLPFGEEFKFDSICSEKPLKELNRGAMIGCSVFKTSFLVCSKKWGKAIAEAILDALKGERSLG